MVDHFLEQMWVEEVPLGAQIIIWFLFDVVGGCHGRELLDAPFSLWWGREAGLLIEPGVFLRQQSSSFI